MQTCCEQCSPICDFCKYFSHKIRTEEGYCEKLDKMVDILGGEDCDLFYCHCIDTQIEEKDNG